jgi:hypothetical protein
MDTATWPLKQGIIPTLFQVVTNELGTSTEVTDKKYMFSIHDQLASNQSATLGFEKASGFSFTRTILFSAHKEWQVFHISGRVSKPATSTSDSSGQHVWNQEV